MVEEQTGYYKKVDPEELQDAYIAECNKQVAMSGKRMGRNTLAGLLGFSLCLVAGAGIVKKAPARFVLGGGALSSALYAMRAVAVGNKEREYYESQIGWAGGLDPTDRSP
jgi:hypothetical protein